MGARFAGLGIRLLAGLSILAFWLPASAPASFSGQNGKVFYEGHAGSSGPADVFSVNPDGTEKLNLTFENGFSEERPSASADGKHVVFQSFREGGWNIFSINADGSNPTNLTKTKDPVINFEPAWSADGSTVAFMRQAGADQDIWTVSAAGGGPVNLTESLALYSTSAEYSPDGTKIVFVGAGPTPCCSTAYNNDIWVMDANGSNAKQLTETDFPTQNTAPTWSADGASIAYSTSESPGAADNGIHVMGADGSGNHRLLPNGAPVLTGGLSWAPDGTKILYENAGGGSLSIMDTEGFGTTPLVGATAGSAYPSWVPAAAPSGGGVTPPPPAGNTPLPPAPRTKALVCKKGFKKKVVKGKRRCVKKHKHRKHKTKP